MKSGQDELGNILREEYGLTWIEVEILGFLAKGFTRKEIGSNLNLSVHTVDTHLASAYKKLGVRNEAEAVVRIFSHWSPSFPANVLC